MSDAERFIVFMGLAFVLFVVVVLFTTRKRNHRPHHTAVFGTSVVVVVGGMLFARYCHIYFPAVPGWIYYCLPALTTFLFPPFALRMSRLETAQYVPLAVIMAPVIHVFFSLFIGWHDYMPFPIYIHSLQEIFQRLR